MSAVDNSAKRRLSRVSDYDRVAKTFVKTYLSFSYPKKEFSKKIQTKT